jgi:hypothetical protein
MSTVDSVVPKQVVHRERNKQYYRVLHLPIWVFVFFVLPGPLTFDLYTHGPDARHGWWLALVLAICIWRGLAGRLPGVERQPYITHWGIDQRNLPYRVVCYTAAWIDLFVPFALNVIGLVIGAITGKWILRDLYWWLYYPLALLVVLIGWLNLLPRTRRSTAQEGVERAWFYVAIWIVVPAQLTGWGMWRLASKFGLTGTALAQTRLLTFAGVAAIFAWLGVTGNLGRTTRFLVSNASLPIRR